MSGDLSGRLDEGEIAHFPSTQFRAMASSIGPKHRMRMQDLAIAEDVKISIEKALRLFLDDDSTTGNDSLHRFACRLTPD